LGSLISNARAREDWGKDIYLFSFLKIIGSPAKRDWGWEAAAHSASRDAQSRKFFLPYRKNKKGMARAKIIGKIFCFVRRKASAAAGWDCHPTGGSYPVFRWK